jgi:hypothetical protein
MKFFQKRPIIVNINLENFVITAMALAMVGENQNRINKNQHATVLNDSVNLTPALH